MNKACFTLGVSANVQPKSSIPIGAKVEIIRIGFTLGEPVFLVKEFRLFRLERIFLGVRSVDTVRRCITSYLLAKASLFVMPCFSRPMGLLDLVL